MLRFLEMKDGETGGGGGGGKRERETHTHTHTQGFTSQTLLTCSCVHFKNMFIQRHKPTHSSGVDEIVNNEK